MKRMTKIILSFMIVAVFSGSVLTETANASKGDFYNNNKEFFEPAPDSYKDILKKYNKKEQTIECGRFQITCNVYKIIFEVGVAGFDYMKDLMKKTIIHPNQILKSKLYNKYEKGLSALSKVLLAIFIAFNMVKIVSLRMSENDDAGIVMNEKLLNILVIGIFLFVYTDIMRWILNAQNLLNGAILSSMKSGDVVIGMITNFLMAGSLFTIIVILCFALILIALMLQFFYRLALVAILYIVGPIAIITKLNDTYNFFDFWLKQIVTTFLTLFMQLLCTVIGLQELSKTPSHYGEVTHIFLGGAFFILALTIPKIMGEWGFSTGSARSVMSGARTAAMLAFRR